MAKLNKQRCNVKVMNMKISACYIAKNEVENLAKSLASLRNQVDEIILVDTGSTDDTKNIAIAYGAKVFEYQWQDDFSAPRNLALEKAQGDWIIFIDCDEYFATECMGRIRSTIEKVHYDNFRGILLLRRYDIDVDKNKEILADTLVSRIYYHNPHYRYAGFVHEELLDNGNVIPEQKVVPAEDLWLIHTGYSERYSQDKAKRNLRLLEKELSATNAPERLYMYLADAYLGLNQKDKAEHYARLDVARGRQNTTYASRSYRILLQLSLDKEESAIDRFFLCQAAVRDFPENPEFRADLGECLGILGYCNLAAEEMEKALICYHQYYGIEPMLMTPEDAENIKKRIAYWHSRQKAVTLPEVANALQMLILALCCMDDEGYWQFSGREVIPEMFAVVLDRMHGGKFILNGEYGRAFADIAEALLEKEKYRELEKLLNYAGELPQEYKNQLVSKLDEKIKR